MRSRPPRAAAAADRRHRGVLDTRGASERVAHAGRSIVGSPDTVRRGLEQFVERTGADELIVASAIYDHAARLRSYELLASLRGSESGATQP